MMIVIKVASLNSGKGLLFIGTLNNISGAVDFLTGDAMIVGDFNVPGVDWNSSTFSAASSEARARAEETMEFVNFNGLYQLNTTTNGAGNTLDLCMTKVAAITFEAADCPLVSIDKWHPPFTLSILLPARTSASNQSLGYNYSRWDYLGFYNHLRNVDWSVISLCSNIDSAVQGLTDIVAAAMNNFIPRRSGRTSNDPFWFSRGLRHTLRKKARCHKKYKNTGIKNGRVCLKTIVQRAKS